MHFGCLTALASQITRPLHSGYIINYRGDEREWTSEQVPNTNIHVINEIRCGTKYQFYLNAFNEAGRSEPSEMVMVKTQGTGQ